MQAKLKTCAGYNGVEHEAYIYKNIEGKKYCKICTMRLEPPKAITKVSKKQAFKITFKKEQLQEDMKFYMKIWNERTWEDDYPGMLSPVPPRCYCCDKNLGSEPNLCFFHHVLEKRNFPEYRHLEENILILCTDCHSGYESNPSLEKFKKIELYKRDLVKKLLNT